MEQCWLEKIYFHLSKIRDKKVKFKLDENVPWVLKNLIKSIGQHEVDSVFHETNQIRVRSDIT